MIIDRRETTKRCRKRRNRLEEDEKKHRKKKRRRRQAEADKGKENEEIKGIEIRWKTKREKWEVEKQRNRKWKKE